MKVQVLQVPDCPHAPTLVARLAELLGDGVRIDRVDVADEHRARSLGMRGSPTLLVDGVDPFPTEAPAGLACRLYRDDDGALAGAPSLAQLRAALAARGGTDGRRE